MTLFKAKEWWSLPVSSETEDCICIAKSMVITRLHDSGDSIAVGDYYGHLRVFRPQGQFQPSDMCLEINLNQPILQVGSGKFMPDFERDLIAVLMPQMIIIYSFHTKEGHTNYGDQYVLVERYSHKLPWHASCFTSGNFGGIVNRELICVQSMNGWLIFYDQEMTLFSCLLPEILLPGPLEYISKSDAFLVLGSGWNLNLYSYHHLSQIGDINEDYTLAARQMTPEWMYNIGESIISIQSLQVTNGCSAILALGERSLYCIYDNGVLKFIKMFDYKPLCCFAYLVGWYYEPNSRLLIMVASENTLHIYENTTLLWSCELIFAPVSISKGYFKGLPGGIALLGMSGQLTCYFLGTEPEIFVPPPLPESSNFNIKGYEDEIEALEFSLAKLNSKEEIMKINESTERDINIIVNLQTFDSQVFALQNDLPDSMAVLCKLEVSIKPNIDIENLSVSFVCRYPFIVHETIVSFENVSAENLVQNYVFTDKVAVFTSSEILMVVIFTDKMGQVRTLNKTVNIPSYLMYTFCSPLKEADCKITLEINSKKPLNLKKLFSVEQSRNTSESPMKSSALALCKVHSEGDVVTIIPSKTFGRFRIQSKSISSMYMVIKTFIELLISNTGDNLMKDHIQINLYGTITSDILNLFFEDINRHAETRRKMIKLQDELTVLSRQFILIQKRVLVKYCAYPPANCDGLEFLMKDTQKRITVTTKNISDLQTSLSREGSTLSASIKAILLLLKLSGLNNDELNALQDALCPEVFEQEFHGWEEIICQSVPHLLRTTFSKQEKSGDKLAPLNNDDILLDANIKKLIKYVKLLLDRAMKMCHIKDVTEIDYKVEGIDETEDQVAAEESSNQVKT